jgi:hypothetical protein
MDHSALPKFETGQPSNPTLEKLMRYGSWRSTVVRFVVFRSAKSASFRGAKDDNYRKPYHLLADETRASFMGLWYALIMVTVQLDDAVAAALSAQASAQGLTVEAYLQAVVLSFSPQPARRSSDEIERLLDEEATVGPSPSGSFSRPELYGDHD